MRYREDDFYQPCGCHSEGKCSHNDFAWKMAFDAMVDDFAHHMKLKLTKKFLEGKTGWDDPDWTEEQIMQSIKNHVEKENRDMVDVANLAMFLWNRRP